MFYSPIMTPAQPWQCGFCGEARPAGEFARWRHDPESATVVCASHLDLAEWSSLLRRGGAGLRWPTSETVGQITFTFHIGDYEDTPGVGAHEPPEDLIDDEEDDDVQQTSFALVSA